MKLNIISISFFFCTSYVILGQVPAVEEDTPGNVSPGETPSV